MRWPWAYQILLFCLLASLADGKTVPFSANASSKVKELQSEGLAGLLGSEVVALVALYDPAAKGVADFATTWEAVATELQGLFDVGAIDATDAALKWMVDTFKVKSLPAVLAFPSRLTSSKPLPMAYKGKLDQTNLAKWAVKQLPFSLVAKITSEPNFKTFRAGLDTPKVCVFHNDSEVSPVVRSLSLAYADRLSFGEVKVRTNKTLQLAEKEGVAQFPALVVYKGKDERAPFGGGLGSVLDVQAFLEPHALSLEARDKIRQERRERADKEEQERREREAQERAQREARKRAEAAEKKRKRREKRRVAKARDEAYRVLEDEWQALDGEYIQVRETGWDQIPDWMVA